jgi:hypothetical protein
LSLSIAVELSTDLGAALARDAAVVTNTQAALRSLRARRGARADGDACCRVVVFELPAEELIVCLAAGLGLRAGGRLFGLCGLLELFGRLPRGVSWERVAEAARRHRVQHEVAAGLALATAVLDLDTALPPAPSPPRLLEWARYGPASVERRTGLRRAYLYLLALLSLRGGGAKARYVGRSLVGPPHLFRLLREVAGAFRRPEPSLRDFAYWLERNPREQA